MSFKNDLKRMLGSPFMDVELDDGGRKDDYELILRRTKSVIGRYLPCEHIIAKAVPSDGNGSIDLSEENPLQVTDVYAILPRSSTIDPGLPWSIIKLKENAILSGGNFWSTDFVMYQNAVDAINRATNNVFSWRLNNNTLYVTGVPAQASGIGIVMIKAISDLDDLPETGLEYELALRYAKGLAKQHIGALLRKHKVNGMDMPGDEYISEGKTEVEETMAEIRDIAYYPGGM